MTGDPPIAAETRGDIAAGLSVIVGRFNRAMLGASGGLSYGQLSALAAVARLGPLRLADLAQSEVVSAPAITRVVAELEQRGLVARTVDADDRRAFRIAVTEGGRAAVARARAARAEVVAGMLAGLSPAELATVSAALPALERVIEDSGFVVK